ncbi:MAG TPA: SDR family oxidoreductase [Actinomycetota bacterium]|jgi:3-oxoacyl-[acyl-carrier protein] reductase
MPLSGRVCVVTGAGRGIGRHTAETLGAAGASLALCSRSPDELAEVQADLHERFGTEVLVRCVDVADYPSVAAFADVVGERFGRVDVLVNNAGVYGPVGLITEVEPGAWASAVSVNLLGVMHAIRAFGPAMQAAGGGRIINVGGGGVGGPGMPARVSAYTASKAAVAGLTETLSKELAPFGILVNAVAPGAISTSLIDTVIEAGPEAAGVAFHAGSVAQRAGGDSLDKVGDAMLFLASERSGGLTGKVLSAKWDPLDRIGQEAARLNATSLYTLRRIDGVMFDEVMKS